jgi:hypothetical protein
MILGRILLTPPLPGWTPVVGNVVLHAPYTHDLAPSDFEVFGRLVKKKNNSEVAGFRLTTSSKPRSRSGFENMSPTVRVWKILYTVISVRTSVVAVLKNKGLVSIHKRVRYLTLLTSIQINRET